MTLFDLLKTLLFLHQVPFQPTKLIFVGIDVLFSVRVSFVLYPAYHLLPFDLQLYQAAEGVSASYDALLELFEGIGSFLKRLDIYAKLSLSPVMKDIIVKMMVELVSVLALARKQIKQGRFSKCILTMSYYAATAYLDVEQFAKKLLGDTEIESILRRLDRLTQEEARMMDAQILEVVYGLMSNMKVVMDGEYRPLIPYII